MRPLLCFCLFFVFLASLGADSITLKNGSVIRGEVTSETASSLRVNVGFGLTQMISKSQIMNRVKEKPEVVLLYLGNRELKRGQVSRALKTLKRAHEADGENHKVRKALAAAWVAISVKDSKRRYPQAALQDLLEAQKILPKDANIISLIKKAELVLADLDELEKQGRKYHITGKYRKAVDVFDRLIVKDFSRGSSIRIPYSESLVALGDVALKDPTPNTTSWKEAADYYDLALIQNPDLILAIEDRWVSAHLNTVAEEINNRNYQFALQEIMKVLGSAPENDNALYLLGVTYRNLQDNKKAEVAFKRILKNHNKSSRGLTIKELTERANKHFKTQFTLTSLAAAQEEVLKSLGGDWKKLEGKGWVLFHHSPYFADQIKLVMDDMLERVTEEFSGKKTVPKLEPILEVYLYRDFDEYKKLSKSKGWSAGVTRTTESNGVIKSRRILSYQSAQFMQSTLPHELGHVILPLLLGKGASHLPHWLNEGMAVRLEPKFKTDYYRNLIQQAKAAGTELSLETILGSHHYPGDEDKVKLFYAKCYVFVDHLIKDMGKKDFLKWAAKVDHDNSVKLVKSLYGDLEKLDVSVFDN